jgi:hypothetical protein
MTIATRTADRAVLARHRANLLFSAHSNSRQPWAARIHEAVDRLGSGDISALNAKIRAGMHGFTGRGL